MPAQAPIYITQSDNPELFPNAQWILTPLPNNMWCMVLSGVAIINYTCGLDSGWNSDTVRIRPNMRPVWIAGGFDPGKGPVSLEVEQYATYGSLNSIFDKDTSVNAGFAVNETAPYFNDSSTWSFGDGSGIDLDIAARDSDATLLRVGYYLMAIGTISQATPKDEQVSIRAELLAKREQ
jgi:hypothetical protein